MFGSASRLLGFFAVAISVVVILLFVGGYVGIFDLLPQLRSKIQENDHQFIQSVGNAGVFYSFLIGVPLSVAVALLGALIGAQITDRQGDIETLRFIEEKIGESQKVFIRIVKSLRIAMSTGNGLSRLISEKIQDEAQRSEEAGDEFDVDRVVDSMGERYSQLKIDLCNELGELCKAAEVSKSDLYAPLILRRSLSAATREGAALSYIQQNLPADHGINPIYLKADVYDIAPLLLGWANALSPQSALTAKFLMPTPFKTSDLVGLMLARAAYAPTGRANANKSTVKLVYFNLGAAWIMQAYRSLPQKDDVSELFKEILERRSAIALRLLDTIGPDVANIESRHWLKSMDEKLDDRSNYIILRMESGDRVSYDPDKHGSLAKLELRPV